MCVLVQVDVAVPEWMQKMEQSDVPVRSMEAPVPLASVRLVYPLTDTETGETRDVIVKKLVNTAIFHSKALGRAFWKRMIPGLNVVVPWPKLPEAEKKDHDCDTLRLDVETRTFVPTLLRPPMPESIIDELRNKYSKFRTRHDPEYIEARRRGAHAAEGRPPERAEAEEGQGQGKVDSGDAGTPREDHCSEQTTGRRACCVVDVVDRGSYPSGLILYYTLCEAGICTACGHLERCIKISTI
jgi:hypothetical protein